MKTKSLIKQIEERQQDLFHLAFLDLPELLEDVDNLPYKTAYRIRNAIDKLHKDYDKVSQALSLLRQTSIAKTL